PWHGYDYCPLDGSSEFGDSVPTFPVEVRDDGVYLGLEPDPPHQRTVTDVMAETLTNWGVRHVFGMVGHSNLGLADALRRQEVDLAGAFGSVAAWSQPVLDNSKHAELMTLACKHAILRRDVSHLIFPDEVQTRPAGEEAEPSSPDGRITPLDITPPAESVDRA